MSMNFASAAQRVRGLLVPRKAANLPKSALTDDRLRDNVVDETIAASERLQSAASQRPVVDVDGHEVEWSNFGDCLTDYMRAAFGFEEPQLRPRDQVRPSHRLEREVIDATVRSPDFQDGRAYTRANQFESTVAGLAYADALVDAYAGLLAEHVQRSEQMGTEEQVQKSADDMFDSLRKQARKEIEDLGEVQDQTKRDIKKAVKQSAGAGERLGQLIEAEANSTMRADAAAAARSAAAAAGEEIEVIGQLPGVCKGDGMKLSPDQQLELARRWANNPHMRALARFLGRRLRNMRRARRSKLAAARGVRVGVETGDQLHKVLPREFARAASPVRAMRTLFVKDYVEKNLLQYRTERPVPTAKGPIVCVLDGSWSMKDEPREWAGSLEIGLLSIANDEKRPFASVHFGCDDELESWTFPKGEGVDPMHVVAMAEQFFAGGTDIALGMREAARLIAEEPGFKTADIVLLTDGEDTFGEDDRQIRDRLRAQGVRIQGISILQPDNAYLAEMCESYLDVSQLADTRDEALGTLAANLT